MKNLFNGKKKWISLLIICLLLVGLLVVIRYTSLNKNTTTSLTASGDNKESNSPTNENKENNESIPQTENNDNIENTNITKEDSKENSSNDKSSNNTQNNNNSNDNNNSTENSKPLGSSSNNTISKPENKPTTPSKPENKPSKPNTGGGSKPSHSHNWVAVTKKVHHKDQGHYENVLVKPAWTEKVPIYEERERSICNGCGKDITSNPYAHMEEALAAGNTKCSGYHSEWKKVQVGTKKVHHKAQYKKKWVVDKKAWTETVVTGHKCSGCGQTK